MKSNIKEITIVKSCSEEWSLMSGDQQQRNCDKCAKNVRNFENYSTSDLINYFESKDRNSICGRFKSHQLDDVKTRLALSSQNHFIPLVVLTGLTLASCNSIKYPVQNRCENHVNSIEILNDLDTDDELEITGIILDENGEALMGAVVYEENTKNITYADENGKFSIKISSPDYISSVIMTNYVGYGDFSIKSSEVLNKNIEITLRDHGTLLGEVVVIKQPLHKRIWNKLFKK